MNDKRIVEAAVFGLGIAAATVAFADPFGAPPDELHAWAVHDDYRPGVAKIVTEAGKPPSDAIVLFDGTAESVEKNWCSTDGKPTKWTLDANGELISVRGAGYICTKRKFADCQLHVEWAAPAKVQGSGQGRGNSGVFLPGGYEIQVLDSYETDPSKTPNPNPNYSDGQAGAAYGQNPPLVNPCRAPGVFNTYDIIFHAPVFGADGKVVKPATATVLFNGVLIQDNWMFDGPTDWRIRANYDKVRPGPAPIKLQDHGNPVHYRNIWVRELAPQGSNILHGRYFADREAVKKQRAATAAKLDAEFDAKWGGAKCGRKAVEAWRIVAYEATPARLERAKAAERAFVDKLLSGGVTRKNIGQTCGVGFGDAETWFKRLAAAGVKDVGKPILEALRKLK